MGNSGTKIVFGDMPEDEQGSLGGAVYGSTTIEPTRTELNKTGISWLDLIRFYPDSEGSEVLEGLRP